LSCPIQGCGFQTKDVEVIGAAAILNLHSHEHAPRAYQPGPTQRPPKLDHPMIKQNSTTEEWDTFLHRWETFQIRSFIPDGARSTQLPESASQQLGDIVLRASSVFATRPSISSAYLLCSCTHCVRGITIRIGCNASGPNEPFRTFTARVQGNLKLVGISQHFTVPAPTATLHTMVRYITRMV